MTIAHLFDHTLRVWRIAVTSGALREEVRTPVLVLAAPSAPNAAVDRPAMPYGPAGAGNAAVGSQVVYMDAEADVRQLDVLEVVDGPQAPRVLQVDEPPYRPRGHHLELRCRAYLGALELEGAS